MNKEVARKWVEALRSGEYKQTRQALRDTTGFCCVGVLCDIYAKETAHGDWDGQDFVVGDGIPKLDEYDNALTDDETMEDGEAPRAVKEWSGLRAPEQDRYIDMNDAKFFTFAEIASQIEKDAGLSKEDTPNG